MIIKQSVIDQVNNRASRIDICKMLRIGEQVLIGHLKTNKDNGRLTKLDALTAISTVSGIPVLELTEAAVVERKVA